MNDRFLRACRREPVDRTPIWLMRQAGRYLPEYRALREKYDMLTMCRTPDLAVEVTLQPLRRFDLDAAILFSDIMIPLTPMGVDFQIVESVGPVVANPVRDQRAADALRLIEPEADVPFVIEAVRALRRELDGKVPLIGFAGAPFTLASYIVEGKPSRDLLLTKKMMHCDPAAWHTLMDKLAQTIAAYLLAQIRAGAQAVQLFDSWIGALSPRDYREYVLPHSKKIFDAIAPTGLPRIHFGTGTATLLELMRDAGGDVIGVDWRVPLGQAWQRLGDIALQGNLDPAVMLTSPDIIERHACEILAQAKDRCGHIFNLGHGVLPNTPIENVDRLVEVVHHVRVQ
ncbi:MAG: uroporphyrinogen decarboxylase [Chloroflexota bacterium]|nr:uroporphyrinogen decarboxylase [Chloroflexota bacterium]